MTAENYHLKWDSHLSFLNSSVATLYKNEKFADVVLYSSSCINGNNTVDNGIPTVGISAHKFILSSCSQFFATMFETAPISTPNGVIYIVLPPELSHRAIQILVQYMYSGEATVANDILNEVLRGGEILKIRGLCRSASSSSQHHQHHHHHHHHHHQQQQQNEINSTNGSNNSSSHFATNSTRILPPPLPPPPTHIQQQQQLPVNMAASELYSTSKCPPPAPPPPVALPPAGASSNCYGIDHIQQQQQQHSQFRGLGASVVPKESPVIVKSPKMPQMGLLAPVSKHPNIGGISINKEVAIDPEDKCCYQINQHEPLPAMVGSSSTLCSEVGCSSCPIASSAAAAAAVIESEQMRRDDLVPPPSTTSRLSVDRLECEYMERSSDEQGVGEEVDLGGGYSRRTRRGSRGDRVRDYYVPEHYDNTSGINCKQFMEPTNSRLPTRSPTPPPPLPQQPPPPPPSLPHPASLQSSQHSHKFLPIKQEPTDWTTSSSSSSSVVVESAGGVDTISSRSIQSPVQSPKQPIDFKMPPGSATAVKIEINSAHSADEDESPESHARDYDSFTHLVCDICKKSFDNPKSWMHHVETHTHAAETVTSNSATSASSNGGSDALTKAYLPKKRRRVSQQENNMDHVTLLCDLCSTSFETAAEWVRHMNSQHTEIELAMFNSKKDNEQKTSSTSSGGSSSSSSSTNITTNATSTSTSNLVSVCSSSSSAPTSNSSGSQPLQQPQQRHHPHHHHHHQTHKKFSTSSRLGTAYVERTCDICNKKFSSHNSMLLHKRSHPNSNGSINSTTPTMSTSSTRTIMENAQNDISEQCNITT